MKGTLFILAALAFNVNGAAIEARQRGGDRPTGRPGAGGGSGVAECGLDAFGSHTAEASQFCSQILRTGTATATATVSTVYTLTTRRTITITIAPSTSAPPPPPPPPPSTTPAPPTSTPRPPPTTTPRPPSSTPSSTPVQSSSPAPSASAGCGLVGYTKGTAAYYFDSSGTKNTFANCSAACKADTKCKSFGYGEANCMLFDVKAADNVQYNPMSPYTFYDVTCPTELPVKAALEERQITLSLPWPLGPGGNPGQPADPTTTNEAALSSACTCLITSAPASTTVSTTRTVTGNRVTVTQTVTRTVGPGDLRRLRRV